MTVLWAASAREDVDAALRMEDRVESVVGRLNTMPLRTRPGRVGGARELVITGTPYVAILAISDDLVGVVRVLHGAQAWPPQET